MTDAGRSAKRAAEKYCNPSFFYINVRSRGGAGVGCAERFIRIACCVVRVV